jgi:hypothetical protein
MFGFRIESIFYSESNFAFNDDWDPRTVSIKCVDPAFN